MKTKQPLAALAKRLRTHVGVGALTGLLLGSAITSAHAQSSPNVYAWGAQASITNNVPGDATNVDNLAMGFSHAVAHTTDNRILVWGGNKGSTNDPILSVPAGFNDVGGGANVRQIVAGTNWSAVLYNDGSAVSFGYPSLAPDFTGYTNIAKITVAGRFAFMLYSDNSIGINGNATNMACPYPQLLNGSEPIADISSRPFAFWVKTVAGKFYSWSSLRSVVATNIPASVQSSSWTNLESRFTMATPTTDLAINPDGNVIAWNSAQLTPTILYNSGPTNAAIAGNSFGNGVNHALVLSTNGIVYKISGPPAVPAWLPPVIGIAASDNTGGAWSEPQ